MIGQFGVGFYSAFIVADKVTLTTRRAGLGAEHGVLWQSDGKGEYTLETLEKPTRGTEVVLHLRDDQSEFLNESRLRTLVRKYSDHITLPIVMQSDKGEDETINSASALWACPRTEITQEEYDEFYKHVAHDFEPPLAHVHSRVEGKLEYIALLYVPKRAPFDLWERDRRHGIKLYVRRVFIMDDAEQLLPNYLRFVRGVIDSSDLPLNVSREILQHSKDIEAIRNGSVRKILDLLEELAGQDKDKYDGFWGQFGQVLKEGVVEDGTNRERIAKLLRFSSSLDDSNAQHVALTDYVTRMKEAQKKIYYVTAETFLAAKNSPHLEIFRAKGIEVLLLSDRIDEWVVNHLTEFEGKSLQSITRGALDLGELDDKDAQEKNQEAAADFKELLDHIQQALEGKVKEVRITHRLTNSPACLVREEHDLNANFERLLKAAGQKVTTSKPILEINAGHPIVARLRDSTQAAHFADWSQVLFDQALLSEGGELEDPAGFVTRMNNLLLAFMK